MRVNAFLVYPPLRECRQKMPYFPLKREEEEGQKCLSSTPFFPEALLLGKSRHVGRFLPFWPKTAETYSLGPPTTPKKGLKRDELDEIELLGIWLELRVNYAQFTRSSNQIPQKARFRRARTAHSLCRTVVYIRRTKIEIFEKNLNVTV